MALTNQRLRELRTYFFSLDRKNVIDGDVVPKTSSELRLGSRSKRFHTIYADRIVSDNVEGFSGGSVPVDHGDLSGLNDDDHNQYLPRDGSRGMSGSLNMGGQYIQNVARYAGLEPNDYIEITTGASLNYYTDEIGSGSSLVFSIDVNGNIVTVGNVDGVDVSAHASNVSAHHSRYTDAEVVTTIETTRISHLSLANHESGDYTVDGDFWHDASAGFYGYSSNNGGEALLWDNNNVTTGPSISLSLGSEGSPTFDTIQDIRTSATPQFAGMLLTGDLDIGGDVVFQGARTISTTSGDLTIDPVDDDVIFNATLTPDLSDQFDIGRPDKLWRNAYISEIHALIFAEDEITIKGGWDIIGHGAGTLKEDVSSGQNVIDFGSEAPLETNDFVLIRARPPGSSLPAVEYMQVTTETATSGIWNVNRNREKDEGGAETWEEGTPFLILGNTGDPRIELTANNPDSPRIEMLEQGSAYNSKTTRALFGNMRNDYGTGSIDRYGFAVGDYSSGEYLSYNAEDSNGLVISTAGGDLKINPTEGIMLDIPEGDLVAGDSSGVSWNDPTTGRSADVYSFQRPGESNLTVMSRYDAENAKASIILRALADEGGSYVHGTSHLVADDSTGDRYWTHDLDYIDYNTLELHYSQLNWYEDGYSTNTMAMDNGNVYIHSFAKGSGSFDIAHPDPKKEDMRLRHYMVETDTPGDNLYRYEVRVEGGTGSISLPDYYEHLNENSQAWVSAQDTLGRVSVRIDNGKIIVSADRDGTYNVLVIGTRKDKVAREIYNKYGVEYKEEEVHG